MLTVTHQGKTERANKIYINSKYSGDGRHLEGIWLDHDSEKPDSWYALRILEFILNLSEGVDYYTVYDKDGNAMRDFDKQHSPKRK